MRETNQTPPPLADQLTLPADWPAPSAPLATATAAWADWLGRPVLLVASVERAWALLLAAARLAPGAAVGLPANASHDLVEAVKQAGYRPSFLAITPDLTLAAPMGDDCRLLGRQSTGGLLLAGPAGLAMWDDHADTLPAPGPAPVASDAAGITLWGLGLAPAPGRAGALLALTAPERPAARAWWAALLHLARAEPGPDPALVLAQRYRLATLASRQQAVLAELWRGLDEAAGLSLQPVPRHCLAHQVAVRIPTEADPATFYAYVGGERTPARWLPLVRPLNPAAIASPAARARLAPSAEALARWLLVPAGPDDDETAIGHAVLGVVKAAEYLGVRWRTRPSQAAAYAAHLTSVYGPDHDAYRPAFDLPEPVAVTATPWPS